MSQRVVRVALGIRQSFRDNGALRFRRALLRFRKRFGHRARRHFLTFAENLSHRFRLRLRLHFGRFRLRFGNRFNQRLNRIGSARYRQLCRPLRKLRVRHRGLTILRPHQFLNARGGARIGLRRLNAGLYPFRVRRIIVFRFFQRLSQLFDFALAVRVLSSFGQSPRQHFHLLAGFFLRLLHHLQLVLIHFFLRSRHRFGQRFGFGAFLFGNLQIVVVRIMIVFAVFFDFQIFQKLFDAAPARNFIQRHSGFGIDIEEHFLVSVDQVVAKDVHLTIHVDQPLGFDVRILLPVGRLSGEFRFPFLFSRSGRSCVHCLLQTGRPLFFRQYNVIILQRRGLTYL